jgi:hypothetical protein
MKILVLKDPGGNREWKWQEVASVEEGHVATVVLENGTEYRIGDSYGGLHVSALTTIGITASEPNSVSLRALKQGEWIG